MKEIDDFTSHIESLFDFKGDVIRADADTFDIAIGFVVGNQNVVGLLDVEVAVKKLLAAIADSFDRAFEGACGRYEMQWRERPNVVVAFDVFDYDTRTPLPPDRSKAKVGLWMRLRVPNLPDTIESQLLIVPEGNAISLLNQ